MRMIVHWPQGHVGRPQQDGAATGIEYGDEADEEADGDADGAPEQVGGAEAESDPLLAIDGAGRLLEFFDLFQSNCDQDLVAVLFGPSATPRSVAWLGWVRAVGTLLLLTRVTRWFPSARMPRTILPLA